MSSRPELKIDWATHEAAKYACLHWHYSKTIPTGKNNGLLGEDGIKKSLFLPKRDKQTIASFPDDSGGAAPTITLQDKEARCNTANGILETKNCNTEINL